MKPLSNRFLLTFGADWDTFIRHDVRVLVPGAGLGRLAFEIARLGYAAEGNDFSYHMLMGSNYILNGSVSLAFPKYRIPNSKKNWKSIAQIALNSSQFILSSLAFQTINLERINCGA